MRKTKLSVVTTTAFKKDYKLAMKRGLKISLLKDVVAALAMGEVVVFALVAILLARF